MKSRILVAVVGVPVLAWVVLAAPTLVMMAALCLLSGIAAGELMKCVGVKGKSLFNVLTIAAAALLPAMYWVPALAARRGLISWMLYGLLVLVVFVWGVTGKGNRNVSRGFDPETDNRKLDETKEIIRERSRWSALWR